jgi:hypothetical protein
MIGEIIWVSPGNLAALLFIAALLCAWVGLGQEPAAARFLSWILLLPIGVSCLWAGLFHVVFPERIAALNGSQSSPFQFELGVANLAIGVTGCLAFGRSLGFKAAAAIAPSVYLLGHALGQLRQMLVVGDFSARNAGLSFAIDIICPVVSIILLVCARRANRVMSSRNAAMALRARL